MLSSLASIDILLFITQTGGTLARFFRIANTLKGLRELWARGEKKKYNFAARIGLTFLYLLHIIATGLPLAILFGMTLVASPLATAFIAISAWIKNIADFIIECRLYYKQLHRVKRLQQQLRNSNINLNTNIAFFDEIKEWIKEIEGLKQHRNELKKFLKTINFHANDSPSTENLKMVVNLLQNEYKSILNQELLEDFSQVFNEMCGNVNQIVDEATESINRLNLIQNDLQQQFALLNHDHKNIELKNQINSINSELKKINLIKQYFNYLKDLKETEQKLQAELYGLDAKYDRLYHSHYTPDRKENLKNLEKSYLEERLLAVQRKIKKWTEPNQNNEANQLKDDLSEYCHLFEKQSWKNLGYKLRADLARQLKDVRKKIKDSKLHFKNKINHLNFIYNNPEENLPLNFTEMIKNAKAFIIAQTELHLIEIDKNNSRKSVRFSTLTMGIAILLCFTVTWPISSMLTTLMISIGITAGVSSVMNFIEKNHVQRIIKTTQNNELQRLISRCEGLLNKVTDPSVLSKLNKQLLKLTQELALENGHPLRKAKAVTFHPHSPNKPHPKPPVPDTPSTCKRIPFTRKRKLAAVHG